MIRPRHAIALFVTGTVTFAAVRPLLQEMEMPKPTEEHAMLQKGVGQWEGTVTMFVPGMPSEPVAAAESVRSAGPFWTVSNFKSEFMGQPYRGHGCHGYDPQSGMFQSTWIDSMSSYLSVMKGEYDADSNTLVYEWEAPDMTGQMAPHRSELVASDDAYTMTFYTSDQKTMVIEMERTSSTPMDASSDK